MASVLQANQELMSHETNSFTVFRLKSSKSKLLLEAVKYLVLKVDSNGVSIGVGIG